MNAVPYIAFPTMEELEKYKDTIPAYDAMIAIIREETEKGNVVVNIGDAGGMPQETIVIVDFAYEARGKYEKMKTHSYLNYKYLTLGDRKGDTSLDFGAWKLRMADDLQVQIRKCLEENSNEQNAINP